MGCVSIGFFETSEEVCFIAKSRPPRSAQAVVQLKKTHWTQSIRKDFKRRSYELWTGQEKRRRYILLRYESNKKEHPVRKKPNGNAKSSKPFGRTKASTLQKIKAKSLCKGLSQVYDEVFEEANGVLRFESHCTKNWIYSHLLMSKYNANAVQMCGKHGKCRIYFTFT